MGKAQDWSVTTCLFLFLFQASQVYCTSQYNANHRRLSSIKNNINNVNQQEQRERDQIKSLPSQPTVNFKQYGGYVTVNESAGRSLYYYFVEASNNSLPLVLWLNGGPGCSSLGYGAFEELGPFRVQSDGKTLRINPYAWNNVANILFLESPVGVGFSYSKTKPDIKDHNDKKTTEENYIFLVKWLERFPEYKGREFYVAGESYAGHYAPLLAQNILHNNNNNNTFINLHGVLIGNPSLDPEIDEIGQQEFFANHAVITQESFLYYKANCKGPVLSTPDPAACMTLNLEYDTNIEHLNQYAIYADVCLNTTLTNEPKEYTTLEETSDPCIETYVTAYLNRAEVQSAMHVVVNMTSSGKHPYWWELCRDAVTNTWKEADRTSTSMLPVLKELMSHPNLRVWVFSGDMDSVVSVVHTTYALKKMNLTVVKTYRPWTVEGEVGGYVEDYKGNHKFATVRGAGHEVPFYKPKSALALFTHFTRNTPLPTVESSIF